MPDGSVLVTGEDVQLYLPTSETFVPASGNFRAQHTSTLLPDGTVLLAGGWTGTAVMGTADIYRPPVLTPSPVLFSVPNTDGQGAIVHTASYGLATSADPAVAGEYLAIYLSGLTDGGVIPPHVWMGGRLAEVVWFGNVPGVPGLDQINVRVPFGVAAGANVPVRVMHLNRPTNQVTIGVR